MATSIGSTNLTTANTWQLLEAINPDPSQSSTMAVYTNGNLVTSGVSQPGTTTVTAPLFINGRNGTSTNSYASYLAEVVVFNTGLSLSNRQMIEGYLAWKWGLQGNLPNTHPYYSATPSAGTTAVGNLTVDTTGNIQVAPTNTFRVLGPTEWRTNMITVSGTSLTIPTPTTGAPTTYSAALYTLTNTGFNALTLPTYTAGSPGVFWELYNSTASNLTIAVTYTSGSGLGSSFTLNAGSSTNIYWSGSAFQAISGQGPTGPTGPGFTTITTPGSNFVLTTANSTSSNTAVANSNLTFNGSNLILTGTETINFNGSTSTTTYGTGVDTLSLNSTLTQYSGGIASVYFGSGSGTYPLGRIAAVDSSLITPPTSALTFQTVVVNGSFSPNQVSGLSLWLDAADASTFSFTSGSNISVWRDKSTLSNHLTLSGGVLTAGTVVFSSATGTYANPTMFAGTTGTSVFFALSPVGNGHPIGIVASGGTASHFNWTDGTTYENIGFSSRNTLGIIFPNSTNQIYTNIANRGGNTLIFRNGYGNQVYSATYGNSQIGSSFMLGSIGASITYQYTGTHYETLYYNRVLTTAEQQLVEGYLAWKWNLVSTLPAGHAYKTVNPIGTSAMTENMRIHSNGFVGIQNTTPATTLDVNGGVTIRNGLRPLYSNVSSGTSLTVPANSYGYNFNITTSSLTGITLPTVVWSNDSNGYWTFRNNTSGYLPITFTYTGSYTTAPTNPVTIPPANSVTIMVTYPSGSTSNYVLF